MSTPILRLPVELQHVLVEHLTDNTQDLLNLSCTRSFYRALVAPYVFKSITLRNNDKSGASVSAIAGSPNCRFVKSLHYQGLAPLPRAESRDEWPEKLSLDVMRWLFPRSVDYILSDLGCFPELEELIIEFPYDYDEWRQAFWDFEDAYHEYDAPGLRELEETYEWRALMARSFAAVARNNNHRIKTLELRQFVAKSVSALDTQSWRDFLGKVERFKISLRGWAHTRDQLFDHLSNVHHFTLVAPDYLLEQDGAYEACLALPALQMPRLQTLHLRYCFINAEIIKFLVTHASTLECIKLHNCFGAAQTLTEVGCRWADLFDALVEAQPKRLLLLEVLPVDPPLTDGEIGQEEPEAEESEDVQQVRRALCENENRRVFAYAEEGEDPGDIWHNYDMNIEAFVQGDDQRAYNRLMAIVEENSRVVEVAGDPQDKKIESTKELE